ncbi:MAG: hypothetical protein ACLUDU_07065 [Butyricimonas faecihominis]
MDLGSETEKLKVVLVEENVVWRTWLSLTANLPDSLSRECEDRDRDSC